MLLKLISFTYISDYSINGTVITLDSQGVISNDDEALQLKIGAFDAMPLLSLAA